MSSLCPLCSLRVSPVELWGHLRRELNYTRWECRFCPVAFFDFADARDHFHPDASVHPQNALSLLERIQWDKERRIRDLVHASAGAPTDQGPAQADQPPPQGPPAEPAKAEQPAEEEEQETVELELPQVDVFEPAPQPPPPQAAQMRTPQRAQAAAVLGGEEERAQAPVGLTGGAADESMAEEESSAEEEPSEDATEASPAKLVCAQCRKRVAATHVRRHATTHLPRGSAPFQCKACGEELFVECVSRTVAHGQQRHPGQPPQLLDRRDAVAPALAAVRRRCFPDQPLPQAPKAPPKAPAATKPAAKPTKTPAKGKETKTPRKSSRTPSRTPKKAREGGGEAASKASYAECVRCGQRLQGSNNTVRHVAQKHNDVALVECGLCDWTSRNSDSTFVRRHFDRAHPGQPQQGNFKDNSTQMRAQLLRLRDECFPK